MPNLVHSLDGCTIALLYKELLVHGVKNLYTIHDCFATTTDNVPFLIDMLKGVYIKLYSEYGYLSSLDTHIRNTIENLQVLIYLHEKFGYMLIKEYYKVEYSYYIQWLKKKKIKMKPIINTTIKKIKYF